jgi:hypothetical protein
MFEKLFAAIVVLGVVTVLALPPNAKIFSAGSFSTTDCGFNLVDNPNQCDDSSGGGCTITAKICEIDSGNDGDYWKCQDGQGDAIECDKRPGCSVPPTGNPQNQPLVNKGDCQD